METSNDINYQRIASAITYIAGNFKSQPRLDEVAGIIHLSPHHFQRLFTEWAGVSPKKFLQYISVEHAKKMLAENRATLFHTAFETGLSGTGRLHDLFVTIEGMTPGEYKNGGENLRITYGFGTTPFGEVIVAATPTGICHLAFADDRTEAVQTLQHRFPNAGYKQEIGPAQQQVFSYFARDWQTPARIKLHLKGSAFQLKVWEALLKIPAGQLTTYGVLANSLQHAKASRAVGTAVGENPVAVLIPCHRVIRSTGIIGQYHWGSVRKTAMIGWEAAKTRQNLTNR